MTDRHGPLKPHRPVFALGFPKIGPVKGLTKDLPRSQDDLESEVGSKVIEQLQKGGITVSGLRHARGDEEPADLIAFDAAGAPIKIQVVEVVDQVRRHSASNAGDMHSRYKTSFHSCSTVSPVSSWGSSTKATRRFCLH